MSISRTISPETRERMRQAALNRSPEQEARRLAALRSAGSRAAMSTAVRPARSPEYRRAISESLKRNGVIPPHDPDQMAAARAKAWESNRGRKRTPEQIVRITEATRVAKAGKPHPMLGRKHSDETRAKLSISHTGKVGPAASNWQGGINPPNKAARSTPEYRAWRAAVFQRDNHTCQRCGVRGGVLHANHIYAFADFPERRTDVENGVTLCRDCHLFITSDAGRLVEPQWYIRARDLEVA